jgi:KaiC/GvpD/RAD55 family RecA-like ATPase
MLLNHAILAENHIGGRNLRPSVLLCLALVLLAAPATTSNVQAQPSVGQLITLYAHSTGNTTILNASPPIGPGKYSDVSKSITFSLNPVLGESIRMHGSLIYTLILNASAPSSGIVSVWLSELKLTGETIPVSGTNTSDLVFLNNQTQTVVLGTVVPIDYEFLPGSAIQFNVLVTTHSSIIPYLAWDLPSNLSTHLLPTSVKIPFLNPTQTEMDIQTTQPRYGMNGTIVQTNTNCACAKAKIAATLTDAIGVYRLTGSLITTAPNGTAKQVQGFATSDYSLTYSYNTTLTPGFWSLGLRVLDLDGNSYSWHGGIWSTPFYEVRIHVVDESNESLQDAGLEVNDTIGRGAMWNATTDSAGNANLLLPFTDIVGPLNLTVTWQGGSFAEEIHVSSVTSLLVRVPVYHFGIRPVMAGIVPLPSVDVELWSGNRTIATNTTGLNGVARFKEFDGNYMARTYYLWSEAECGIVVNSNEVIRCDVTVPNWVTILVAVAAIATVATVTMLFVRRRTKLQPAGFSYFNELTMGGLPDACFVIVTGNAGSGKSVLLESLASEHLKEGVSCIYVINTDFPSKIREHMATLGMQGQTAKTGRLVFIDSYSAISGTSTNERFYVSSHTDLTGLGLMVTKCVEELGSRVDLYLDSAVPILSSLRVGYMLDFLQSTAGKVKANGGKLCVSVGIGTEKGDMTKLEEAADCIIETHVQESRRGQRRRLRIKKLRGKAYIDKWINFRIESGKGIVFFVRKK